MFSNKARKTLQGKTYLAGLIPLVMAAQAQGIEFYAGGVEAVLNSKISMGSSWRTEQQDATLLSDPNIDDGNRNYKKNDAFSQIFDARNDLMVTYKNFGAIASAKYWYDAALENDDDLDDSQYHELAKFSGAKIMDAYVFGEFEVLDMPLEARLGKQVVSWGDSTFIPGGINSINPYDLNTFARPGAKLKDAVIPVNMAFASIGLSDNLSAEMFYQLEYHESVLEGCGTYFSQSDNLGGGCDDVQTLAADDLGAGSPASFLGQNPKAVNRPDSDGQFGVAFRYVSEALDTEFGLYGMNIHSRTPIALGTNGAIDEAAIFDATFAGTAAFLTANTAMTAEQIGATATEAGIGANVAANSAAGTFQLGYSEDVKIVGLSFATEIATMSISGEVSHQLDVPLNINDSLSTEAIVAAAGYIAAAANAEAAANGLGSIQALADATTGGDTAVLMNAVAAGIAADPTSVAALGLGETQAQYFSDKYLSSQEGVQTDGFSLYDVSQLQLTAIKLFDRVAGADSMYAVVEAGYTFVHSLDDSGNAPERYEGASDTLANTITQDAWGYRAMVGAEYSDVFAGIGLAPELFISHDVDGVSPIANSGFNQGNKRLGLTLNLDITQSLDAAISYNRLTGGDNDRISDRDYASVTVGMQF